MGVLAQISAIIWKDVYVQLIKRHYFIALAEIFLVVLSFTSIENDRPIVPPAKCPKLPCLRLTEPTVYEERNLSGFRAPQLIIYQPNTSHARELMAAAFPSEPPQIVGYPDDESLLHVFKRVTPVPRRGPEQRVVAIQLLSFDEKEHLLPSGYPRDLRFIQSMYDNQKYLSQRFKGISSFEPLPTPVTQRESLAFCQMSLAKGHLSVLRKQLNSPHPEYTFSTSRLPDGPLPMDAKSGYSLTALRAGLGYMVPFCTLVARLVEENQSGMREKLRLVGLNNAVYWLGHFLASLFIGMVAVLCNMTHMLFAPNWHSDFHITYLMGIDKLVVFISFFIFTLLYMLKAMFISLFFTNATAAVVFAMAYWLGIYLVPWFALEKLEGYAADYISLGRMSKLLTSVSPCMGLHWCFRILGCAVITGEDYTFQMVNKEVLGLDNVKMIEIWIVMLALTVSVAIMIWYFGNVLTWALGVPLEPWFPFTIKYWLPGAQGSVEVFEPKEPDGFRFQKYPPNDASVTVSQLEYERKEKHILRDTNFKAYHGEILGIVAPNGAGKTSLCNLLTGYSLPSAGQVMVLGYDMMLQTDLARRHIAYVQQRDVLFADLTVFEHLLFFGSMKDEAWAVLDKQVAQVQEMLQLEPIMNVQCNKLDRSQKKILSLAVALVTCPKVLIMDEVMVKMYPATRKVAWNALIALKSTMCIIAATANVYEVDTRADRLTVFGYAAHKCYGTTSFIQRRYGWGYTVKIVKSPHFRGSNVLAAVRQIIPDAHVLQDQKAFAAIGLGQHTDYTPVASVLNRIEAEQRSFGITSFTISVVTMEDIFFRIVLEMDSGDYQYKANMEKAMGIDVKKTAAVDEHVDYTMANLTVDTEDLGGIVEGGEKYESSIEIQQHVKAVYDLKPSKPTWVQVFMAMIIKRRQYTWQTLALPMFCFIVPTVILVLRGELETIAGPRVSVEFSADNFIYDLRSFEKSDQVFVAYDNASEAVAESGFEKYVRSHKFPVKKVPNMEKFLEGEKRGRTDKVKYVFGAEFASHKTEPTTRKAVAWFSGDAYHSQSLSLNVISTVLLRTVTNDSKSEVLAVLRPVKKGKKLIASRRLKNAKHAATLGDIISSRLTNFLLLPAGISVATASFIFFPMDDRVSNSKRMQFVSGVSPVVYWLANYVWDMFMAMVGLMCMLFPGFLFYQHFGNYGVATTMGYQLYMIAHERGQELISEEHSRELILWLLYLCPPFSASWALVKVVQLGIENTYCTYTSDLSIIHDVCAFVRNSAEDAAIMMTGLRYCCATFFKSNGTSVNPLSWTSYHRDGAMTEMTVMLVEGLVCFLLLVLAEQAIMRHWFAPADMAEAPPPAKTPPDVLAEFNYVNKLLARQDLHKPSLVALDLKKMYGRATALRGVTFHVDPGETFAVMGMLGCGKSTLLDVLSGFKPPSGGTAYIGTVSLKEVARWEKLIGLCPDYDAFLGRLTVRQTMVLHATIRGVQYKNRATLIDHLFALLNLQAVADDTIDNCSASNRRKLAVAVAIVGLPPVLLMDDPATGLDPFAKRTIYKSVQMLRQLSKSAVLVVTTSLCDAVIMCDRMAIMVDGLFRCIGSLSQLRSRLCRGFVLRVKLKPEAYGNPEAWKAIDSMVRAAFPAVLFSGQMTAFVEYEVERMPPWKDLAQTLANLKHHLAQYTYDILLSEVTLEHVILKVAKYQVVPLKGPVVPS
ncbi:phospholipid-transporting ATPase ABCA3-like [Dermacentor variabilis]|uniref:phospholipid-transporting ATPase ABCA3-like n=1 Tax=Dermacentor variabilis TaxID=34621 RepID=UPI003F5BE534